MNRRIRIKGELLFPSAPSLLDEFVGRLETVFAALGKPFAKAEVATLRDLLGPQMEQAFASSPLSQIKVTWWSDQKNELAVHYRIQKVVRTKTEQYEYWVKSRKPPLFGLHPDARAMDLARSLPAGARIADLGAGTGRNALPLARAGFRVDAVDATESFVDQLRQSEESRGPEPRLVVFRGDLLSDALPLPPAAYQMLLLSEVVTDMRGIAEVERLFERADRLLVPGGYLLFNSFVTAPGFQPDALTRELSQLHWSLVLTPEEIETARSRSSLLPESDVEAHEYERKGQPSWPPTGWYAHWARGNDLFGLPKGEMPPMNLRWLTFRKPR